MSFKQVIFICTTCEDINKSKLGMSNFELLETRYESLTGASDHLIKTYGTHEVVPVILEALK